jgi:hypothetical protein
MNPKSNKAPRARQNSASPSPAQPIILPAPSADQSDKAPDDETFSIRLRGPALHLLRASAAEDGQTAAERLSEIIVRELVTNLEWWSRPGREKDTESMLTEGITTATPSLAQ